LFTPSSLARNCIAESPIISVTGNGLDRRHHLSPKNVLLAVPFAGADGGRLIGIIERESNEYMRRATTIIGVVSFICLLDYLLALHDIYVDYASRDTWLSENRPVPEWLPTWTACPLEWWSVRLGYIPMVAFHILFFVGIWKAPRRAGEDD
jgi:hypothetical protein